MLKATGEEGVGKEDLKDAKGREVCALESSLSGKAVVHSLQSWAPCNGPCLSPLLLLSFCSFVFLILLSDIAKESERPKATRGGEGVGQGWGGVG